MLPLSGDNTARSNNQEPRRLSRTVFTTILVFSVAVLVLVTVSLSLIYYGASEQLAEADLLAQTRATAQVLEEKTTEEKVDILSEEIPGRVRYTLVDANGEVLFDSMTEASFLENHGGRPEIVDARKSGDAVASRHSKTFDTDTLYAAVQLDDGSVVRLAQDRRSCMAFLMNALVPIAAMLALLIVCVAAVSHRLRIIIMQPIDDLDVAHPLENDVYAEMEPLLEKIDQQQGRLLEQNRELTLADSMRRDFSSNVSHDMKTPVHVISGYAEILKSGGASPEDVKRFSGIIYDEAQALRKLIDDVLTLSRLDEVSFEIQDQRILDMQQVALRVCDRLSLLASQMEVSLSCGASSGSQAVQVVGNEQLLEEMTCNLVENAIKYNKRGGVVRVKVLRDQDHCVLRVSDTGPGIPVDLQEKVFERFYRMEKSRSKETGGTGLGLAIVKHVVLRHGGEIEVESSEILGTTFTVKLPLLDDSSDDVL